jgi:hypothetical protein
LAPGDSLDYSIFATDPDCDGSELQYSFLDCPSWCAPAGATIVGRVECNYSDTSFKAIAFDGTLADTLIVLLFVDLSNQAPQILDDFDSVLVRNRKAFAYCPAIDDPDDSTHAIIYSDYPAWCHVQNDSLIGIAPDSASASEVNLIVKDYCNSDQFQFRLMVYLCGDANADHEIDVSDAVWIINYVFVTNGSPLPYDAGDANCDLYVDISDAIWIINHVFLAGPRPCDGC